MSALGDWGSVGTAVAAGAGLFYAGRQIKQARKIAQRDMAYRYMDRFNSPDFIERVADARTFWEVAPAERDARWACWQDLSKQERHRIVLPLNIFEEMATMYLNRLVDRHSVDQVLGSTALEYWDEAEWLIARLRAESPRTLLKDWETMNDDLKERRLRAAKRFPRLRQRIRDRW